MEIIFIGTRGYIDARTRRHFRHASTIISYRGKRVMIDCGLDWEKKVWKVKPDAIVITHAHPDHAWGLKNGSPCNVWATVDSWHIMKNFKIDISQRKVIRPHAPRKICGIRFEAFSQIHSVRAPAVGYRIKAGKNIIYYSGDVVYIHQRRKALRNAKLYIGDGATIRFPMIRKQKKEEGKLFGHATIQTQLTWCKKEKVPLAIITHCGSQLVLGGMKATSRIKALAKKRGVAVKIAYDGMKYNLK